MKKITDKEYFETIGLSASQMKTYAIGGAYEFWKTSVFNPACIKKEPTDAMIFGSLAHCLLLEPTEFTARYEVMDWGTKTRNTKKFLDVQSKTEKTIVSPDEYKKAEKMVFAVNSNKLARPLVNGTDLQAEIPLLWKDDETGLVMKAKLDALKRGNCGKAFIIDYKTSSDVREVLEKAEKLQYPLQAVFYCEAVKNCLGIDEIEFLFIVQSNKDGEEDKIAVAKLSESTLEYAKILYEKYKREISDKYNEWTTNFDNSVWQAFPDEVLEINYSRWFMPYEKK